MSVRNGLARRAAIAVVAVAASAMWLGGVAVADDPPGNSGPVKVAGEDVAVGNDAHVGCAFTVDFYGYDEGDYYADVTIEGIAPTEEGRLYIDRVFIGEDAARGGTDLDASAPIDLTGVVVGEPTNRGFHVKLTIEADGSQGADVRHKTFWISDCGIITPE